MEGVKIEASLQSLKTYSGKVQNGDSDRGQRSGEAEDASPGTHFNTVFVSDGEWL